MLHTLQNKFWQAGILPQTGASIAFGRVRYSGAWVDLLRPTQEKDYDNSSNCSSFIMLPWANRIKDGLLRFDGQTYLLQTTKDDGTARHGDVRKREWQLVEYEQTAIHLSFNSQDYNDINFPFQFSVNTEYRLEDTDFVWQISLQNDDARPMPAGFGHHPYFVRVADDMPQIQIPCDQQFEIDDIAIPHNAPVDIQPEYDFRQARSIDKETHIERLLTNKDPEQPVRLIYDTWRTEIQMHTDSIFRHIMLFTAADGTIAIEPQTNANDGFNLHAQGIEAAGILVLQPGEAITGTVKLRLQSHVQ